MQVFIRPYTLPLLLDQVLSSVKSHIGLRNTMDYLKYKTSYTLLLLRPRYTHELLKAWNFEVILATERKTNPLLNQCSLEIDENHQATGLLSFTTQWNHVSF